MCATSNGNPGTTIISCYNPTNAVMKQTSPPSTTSYLLLFDTFSNIIISEDMNPQIGKDKNDKFCLHRHGEYLADFSLKNKLACLNTKFQKRKAMGLHQVK